MTSSFKEGAPSISILYFFSYPFFPSSLYLCPIPPPTANPEQESSGTSHLDLFPPLNCRAVPSRPCLTALPFPSRDRSAPGQVLCSPRACSSLFRALLPGMFASFARGGVGGMCCAGDRFLSGFPGFACYLGHKDVQLAGLSSWIRKRFANRQSVMGCSLLLPRTRGLWFMNQMARSLLRHGPIQDSNRQILLGR